jgi:hypothetical protein
VFLTVQTAIPAGLQPVALILNTIVLIGALVVFELAFAELPRHERQHLRYFYPLLIIPIAILLIAFYQQVGAIA